MNLCVIISFIFYPLLLFKKKKLWSFFSFSFRIRKLNLDEVCLTFGVLIFAVCYPLINDRIYVVYNFGVVALNMKTESISSEAVANYQINLIAVHSHWSSNIYFIGRYANLILFNL